jgi:hypothetical protein
MHSAEKEMRAGKVWNKMACARTVSMPFVSRRIGDLSADRVRQSRPRKQQGTRGRVRECSENMGATRFLGFWLPGETHPCGRFTRSPCPSLIMLSRPVRQRRPPQPDTDTLTESINDKSIRAVDAYAKSNASEAPRIVNRVTGDPTALFPPY